MTIQVLGSGCPTCKKLFELTKAAVKQLNLDQEVEYSTDVSQIIAMGVMSSPVLAIDGKPVMVGFSPDIEKIKKLLSAKTTTSVQPSQCRCGGKC
jgi:small redox-active disulfide protein 2